MTGFNGRGRKRNIDLSRLDRNDNTTVHFNSGWNNEEEQTIEVPELEEGYEEIEEVDNTTEEIEMDECEEQEPVENFNDEIHTGLSIDGKPFIPKQQIKKQSFMDTHVKLTTYLEKNLNQIIRMLQENGQIESITKFINDSVKEHLLNHYQNNSK